MNDIRKRKGFVPFRVGTKLISALPPDGASNHQPAVRIPLPPRPQPPPEPTIKELAENFIEATSKWALAGFPLVTPQQYEARSAVCGACELWDGAARGGLGKCKHPKCGCTKIKRMLATAKCPEGKWPNLT